MADTLTDTQNSISGLSYLTEQCLIFSEIKLYSFGTLNITEGQMEIDFWPGVGRV